MLCCQPDTKKCSSVYLVFIEEWTFLTINIFCSLLYALTAFLACLKITKIRLCWIAISSIHLLYKVCYSSSGCWCYVRVNTNSRLSGCADIVCLHRRVSLDNLLTRQCISALLSVETGSYPHFQRYTVSTHIVNYLQAL